MKSIIAVLLTGLFLVFDVQEVACQSSVQRFEWMLGSWKMETGRGTIIESWVPVNDSSIRGKSVRVSITGDTTLLEHISLVSRMNSFFYIPVAKGQNNDQPVEFRITSLSDTGFVSENPAHDFPKRITYVRTDPDSIHSFIDDGGEVVLKKIDFYYSRIK